MKSTYKLFGTLWDKKPEECNIQIKTVSQSEMPPDHKELYSLFDMVGHYDRSIAFSELLSVETADEFETVANNVVDCDKIYVILDYYPECALTPNIEFYNKRLRQIVYAIENCANKTVIVTKPI